MKRKANRLAATLALALVLVNGLMIWSSAGNGNTPTVAASYATNNPKRPETLVVRVPFRTFAERDRIAAQWGAEEQSTLKGYLTFYISRATYERMQDAGLNPTIDEQTTQLVNNPQLFGKPAPGNFYGGFKTVEETYNFLDTEATTHATLAEVVDYGDSWCKQNAGSCHVPAGYWNGYDLKAIRITNRSTPGPKPVFWFDAGIHAREIAVPEVAMRYISYLLDNYNTNADVRWLLDYNDIWVVPMVNPDGHHIVEQGEAEGNGEPYYQRKNANDTNGASYQDYYPPTAWAQFGTDNNRNFNFKWGCCGGSSGSPEQQTYRGPTAASDPETAAIQNKVSQLIPDQRGPNDTDPAPITTTGVYQNMHSNAGLNLWSWGWTNSQAPNYSEIRNLGNHMESANAYPSGNSYTSCQTPQCLYTVDGGAFDWAYGVLGAFASTTEIDGVDFFVPLSDVDNIIWPANKGALIYQAKIARQPYLIAHGPDTVTNADQPLTAAPGATVQLTATINYNWSGNTFAQNVGAAEYYIDTPPWAGGTATPMNGSFGGSQTVNATANIDTTGLSLGRHIIFVRGRGVNQYQNLDTWGAFSAQFLDISTGAPTPTITPIAPTPTTTSIPPTATTVAPTSTPVPPTATPASPTNTPVLPTATAPAPTPTNCPNPFVDINSNIFYPAIHALTCAGFVNGTDATHYSPAATASRAQFTKIAVLAAGLPLTTPSTTPTFVDVPPSYWAYTFIETAYANGVVQGSCSGNICYFSPNAPITRAQLTKIVVNAFAIPSYTPTTPTFSDVAPSNVFYAAIESAYQAGVVNGYADNTFRPNNNIRRDEMAQILYAAYTLP